MYSEYLTGTLQITQTAEYGISQCMFWYSSVIRQAYFGYEYYIFLIGCALNMCHKLMINLPGP